MSRERERKKSDRQKRKKRKESIKKVSNSKLRKETKHMLYRVQDKSTGEKQCPNRAKQSQTGKEDNERHIDRESLEQAKRDRILTGPKITYN